MNTKQNEHEHETEHERETRLNDEHYVNMMNATANERETETLLNVGDVIKLLDANETETKRKRTTKRARKTTRNRDNDALTINGTKYITINAYAKQHGYNVAKLRRYIREHETNDAIQFANRWLIAQNAHFDISETSRNVIADGERYLMFVNETDDGETDVLLTAVTLLDETRLTIANPRTLRELRKTAKQNGNETYNVETAHYIVSDNEHVLTDVIALYAIALKRAQHELTMVQNDANDANESNETETETDA